MGRFTGKSDFDDLVNMHYNADMVLKGKVILNGGILKLETPMDLIPYYTHLVGAMSSTRLDENYKLHVVLSDKSYIDTEELRWKTTLIRELVYAYEQCKKDKKKFTYENIKDFDNVVSMKTFFEDESIRKALEAIAQKGVLSKVVAICKGKYFNVTIDLLKSFTEYYLYNVKTKSATRKRLEFLKFAADNGWSKVYDIPEDGFIDHLKNFDFTTEKCHPMLTKMMLKVIY